MLISRVEIVRLARANRINLLTGEQTFDHAWSLTTYFGHIQVRHQNHKTFTAAIQQVKEDFGAVPIHFRIMTVPEWVIFSSDDDAKVVELYLMYGN